MTVEPVQWFELATQRIDMVEHIQEQAFLKLQATLQRERFTLLFGLLILILVSIATAVMFQTSKKTNITTPKFMGVLNLIYVIKNADTHEYISKISSRIFV